MRRHGVPTDYGVAYPGGIEGLGYLPQQFFDAIDRHNLACEIRTELTRH